MCIKKIKNVQKMVCVMRGLMGNGYVPKVVLEKMAQAQQKTK